MNLEKFIIFIYNKLPIIKKYRLQKLDKFLEPIGIKKLITTIESKTQGEVIRKIINNDVKEYKEAYEKFKKILKENFSYDDLHNFHYNSEWVVVKKIIFNPFSFKSGTYNYETNKLRFKKNSLNHEFFHMSSTDYDSKYVSSGFSIDIGEKILGDGINEGYTDLLTERYFNEDIEDYYYFEAKFAKSLEKIIGQKTMEKLYLNGNFFGFVKELNKYYEIEEIEKFLIAVDVISLYNTSYLSEEEANKINLLIEDCFCFLLKGYAKTLKNKSYPMEIKRDLIEDYFVNMRCFYSYCGQTYEFNIERINKVIEEYLSKDAILDFNDEELFYNVK